MIKFDMLPNGMHVWLCSLFLESSLILVAHVLFCYLSCFTHQCTSSGPIADYLKNKLAFNLAAVNLTACQMELGKTSNIFTKIKQTSIHFKNNSSPMTHQPYHHLDLKTISTHGIFVLHLSFCTIQTELANFPNFAAKIRHIWLSLSKLKIP